MHDGSHLTVPRSLRMYSVHSPAFSLNVTLPPKKNPRTQRLQGVTALHLDGTLNVFYGALITPLCGFAIKEEA